MAMPTTLRRCPWCLRPVPERVGCRDCQRESRRNGETPNCVPTPEQIKSACAVILEDRMKDLIET